MKRVTGVPNPMVLFAVYALLFGVACFPLFYFVDLPLGDSLNHAARVYILNNLPTDPLLQKYYTVHWDLFSFQSTDLLLPPLARWFGLPAAMQLFVAMTFALLIAGTVAVHRMLFGWVGLWPAAAFLFLYNFPLLLGRSVFCSRPASPFYCSRPGSRPSAGQAPFDFRSLPGRASD